MCGLPSRKLSFSLQNHMTVNAWFFRALVARGTLFKQLFPFLFPVPGHRFPNLKTEADQTRSLASLRRFTENLYRQHGSHHGFLLRPGDHRSVSHYTIPRNKIDGVGPSAPRSVEKSCSHRLLMALFLIIQGVPIVAPSVASLPTFVSQGFSE